MVGLLLLKQLKGLGDETVVKEWVQNPYFQYFCGESEFQWGVPCDPSDLVHFRNRIGQSGAEKILEVSIRIQPPKDKKRAVKEVVLDTTVQEKNITYPTDVKLAVKVIKACRKIAKQSSITMRQSYVRVEKQLMLSQRFAHHPKNYKKALSAKRKLKTIAGRLVRELARKLPKESFYREQLPLYEKVLNQKQKDKDKIYSLHEAQVACIAKGKVAKKFEFGSKVSVAMSKKSNLILGVVNFAGNPHDSQTLESTLSKVEGITGQAVEKAIVDRGYRGKKWVNDTEIILPKPCSKPSERRTMRKRFRRRAAIEPVIGHLKLHFGMKRNFLKGEMGDVINANLAGAAFNFKRWLNMRVENFWTLFFEHSNYGRTLHPMIILSS